MTVEEIAEKERELKLLDDEVARYKAHRPTWPIWVLVLSVVLGVLAARW